MYSILLPRLFLRNDSCYKYTTLRNYLQLKFKPTSKLQTTYYSTGHFPIDSISNLKQDILLYTFEKSKVFKYLGVFGVAQLGVWVYYAGYLFTNLRDISRSQIKTDTLLTESSLWRRINLGEYKYRVMSTALCLGAGIMTAFITYALPSRIIKELTLCKGGSIASIVTYGPFGKPFHFKVPLNHVSSVLSRNEAKSYIPLRIKKTWFFYLVDCKGHFHHPRLFDYTVGTKTVKAY